MRTRKQQGPFSSDPNVRLAFRLQLFNEIVAGSTQPEEMAQLFKGLKKESRERLSALSMSRHGRALVVQYLQEAYRKEREQLARQIRQVMSTPPQRTRDE